jgi:hypothetical protein
MVLRIMARTLKVIFLLVLVTIFSCEKEGLFVKCSDCVTDEPVSTDLNIKLDNNYYGYLVEINVWQGYLEDSVLYKSFSSSSQSSSISVSLNKIYTVTATYHVDGDIYTVVDSATPRVRYAKSQCNDPCYFIYDKEVNLALKGK